MKYITSYLKKFLFFLSIFVAFSSSTYACTGFRIITKDKSVIYARTNEFAIPLYSQILFIPSGTKHSGVTPDGKNGIKWTDKYAILGANFENLPLIMDGINEKGLGVGAFFFPDFAKYQTYQPKQAKNSLASWQLNNWILGNFTSVDEVKKALPHIRVLDIKLKQFMNSKPPVHYFVYDQTGKSIVIEPINGQLKVFDDPIGVITNAPPFDWHLINLRNYVNLTATNVPKLNLTGLKLTQTGQGSGMLGLPGDFTPPSRFVRTAALTQSAFPVTNAEQGVILAWNIINNVNIFKGATRETAPNGMNIYNYTQWTIVADLNNKQIYFRTYDNPNIFMVDMKPLLNSKNYLMIPMERSPDYKNLTNSFQSAKLEQPET
ncbi:MAG: choloylglycine hydrolase family protein [Gammaproteobacteria bacterium]|jgi:choloylglycine hydrolase